MFELDSKLQASLVRHQALAYHLANIIPIIKHGGEPYPTMMGAYQQ